MLPFCFFAKQFLRVNGVPAWARSRFVEAATCSSIYQTSCSKDEGRGTVHDIVFQDITVLSRLQPSSSFRGFDAEHTAKGVTIQNLRFNDRPIRDAAEARLIVSFWTTVPASYAARVRRPEPLLPLALAVVRPTARGSCRRIELAPNEFAGQ